MEKSKYHFRASHPLLFISFILLCGIMFARYYLANFFTIEIPKVLVILMSSLFVLLYIIKNNSTLILTRNKKVVSQIIIVLIIYVWGILLFYLTKEKNVFPISYPQKFIEFCRNAVIQKINNSINSNQANAFAQALILGVKMENNKDIINSYKHLGIIHIIAISGMHLEIIFKNISRITQWLPKQKVFRYLELVIILSAVWTYTLMAFASPSIIRAAIFFCIHYIGKFFDASYFTLNTIAGAVLVVLLFDVKNLENIGLQLSYGAVLGIHFLYPMLSKMLAMENLILVFLWNNLCISLCAQLATLPILLFHFHQIASMVIISNFFMVPLSTFLLYALVLLLVSPNKYGLTQLLGNFIKEYILTMNKVVQYLDSLSLNRSLHITMSAVQVILYYVSLFILYKWLFTKNAKWLVYFVGLWAFYSILKLFSLV